MRPNNIGCYHLCYNAGMNYRTEPAMAGSNPVLEDNPLLALFDAIEAEQRDPGRHLCCLHCQAAVTSDKDKFEINCSHTFQLTNPGGIVFNVACFKHAWGCDVHGEATELHTWFSGFRWRYANCLNCDAHLGWHYTNDHQESDNAAQFFGLIADKLLPVEDS